MKPFFKLVHEDWGVISPNVEMTARRLGMLLFNVSYC